MNQHSFPHKGICFWSLALLFFSCQLPPQAEKVDLALEGGWVLCADSLDHRWESGLVLVKNGIIVYVGPMNQAPSYSAAEIIDCRGKLVTPGWINTHGHAAMSLFRGLADDVALQSWLEDHIWPAEARFMTAENVRIGTRLAILDMLSHGVTAFADMYFFEDEVARAAEEMGIRVLIGEGVLSFPTPSSPTGHDAILRTAELARQWKGHPLVEVSVAPHSPYATSESLLRACDSLARAEGLLLQIHVSETRSERDNSLHAHGSTPVAWLDSLGLLHAGTLAAHAVHLSPADIRRLANNRVAVAHCPESNLKLGSGICPVPDLRAAGVTVAVGTDGAASNNDLNLLQELQTGSKLQKGVREDPTILPAVEWLRMGTIEGAKALGMEAVTGSIEVGKSADLLVYRLDQPHAVPMYDPVSHLIYVLNSSDLERVWIRGESVWANGRALKADQAAILAEAQAVAAKIRSQRSQ